MTYVIRGVGESLMERFDALILGLVGIRKEGAQEDQVAWIDKQTKPKDPDPTSTVSGG